MGWTAFQYVRYVNIVAVYIHSRKVFVKQLARGSDKRYSRKVLLFAGRFTYKHKLCFFVACSENRVGFCFTKPACLTFFRRKADFFKIVIFHIKLRCFFFVTLSV